MSFIIKNHTIIQPEDAKVICDLVERGKVTSLPHLGRGDFGECFEYTTLSGLRTVLKIHLPHCECRAVDGEEYYDEQVLEILGQNRWFPELYGYIEGKLLVMEKIEGKPLRSLTTVEDLKLLKKLDILNEVKDMFNFVVSKGLYPIDVDTSSVIISDGKVRAIDVGCFSDGMYGRPEFLLKEFEIELLLVLRRIQ